MAQIITKSSNVCDNHFIERILLVENYHLRLAVYGSIHFAYHNKIASFIMNTENATLVFKIPNNI